jgi:energy-converting hydrogenase Eha subunit C
VAAENGGDGVKVTRPFKVLVIEIGMLGGIVLAGYLLPASTPLVTFVIAGIILLVVGNVLVIQKLRSPNQEKLIVEADPLPARSNRARIWLLFVAVSLWGAAFDSLFGPETRITFAAMGVAAFLLAQRAKKMAAKG